MKSEAQIQQECRLEASRLGAIVWRNNVGVLKDKNGRPIKYGLCVGSSDLIGIYKGRFLALEIKKKGKNPTPKQQNFIDTINKAGGIAGVARSAEDVEYLLTNS